MKAARHISLALATLLCALNCNRDVSQAKPPQGDPVTLGFPKGPLEAADVAYDGGLKPGWQDWGWGPHDLSSGPAKVNLSSYGGIILHREGLTNEYGGLNFKVQAPPGFKDFLKVKLQNANPNEASLPDVDIPKENVRLHADGWMEFFVPWKMLNPNGTPVDRIMIHAKRELGSDWVKFDKIQLTSLDAAAKAELTKPRSVDLAVDCKAPDHPISKYIYGVAGDGDPWELGATIRRWGGNPTTRYNYLVEAVNLTSDWFFENKHGGSYRNFLDANRNHGLETALTVPTMGWVAKDAKSFGFPVSKLGGQQAAEGDAGNGIGKDGKHVTPPPPTQTSVAAPPLYAKGWVDLIRREDEKRGGRGVHMYILDNEPALWSVTHRDVHPEPVTYDELLEKTIQYATAIRERDPDAIIAGPAEWGWSNYFYSAKDTTEGVHKASDRKAHGDVPLIEWYLKKVREYEQSHNIKLLDVLDLHYYPQGNNVYGGGNGGVDPNTAALRIRSTRSLWDLKYTDESWINDNVRLVPRMKEWIAKNAPGLRTSIGEYNFGGEKHISGALAQAEALGRFGEEGLTYAFYWTFPPKNSPTYWAFRAFRNFDGKGGRFLDRSLSTQMGDGVSLFASRDDSKKHIVAIALNLDPSKSAKTKVKLDGCGKVVSRKKYVYGQATESLKFEGATPGDAVEEELPPYSISVLDITLE